MTPRPHERRTLKPRRTDDAHGDTRPRRSHERLRHLYEISRLLAGFQGAEQTIPAVLEIVRRTLPLRSAVLLAEAGGQTRTTVWPEDLPSDDPARAHAEETYRQLVRSSGGTGLPERPVAGRFILLPLVVDHRKLFGALQVEAAELDEADLVFVNAIVNQLAVALDRHRAWQSDVAARAKAEAANTAKDDFLAVLSHELRTPLNAIIGWTHLLQAGTLDTTESARALEAIARSARVQNQLISDMLDTQRIISGKLSLEMRPVDLGAVIAAARDTLAPMTDAKRVDVLLSLEKGAFVLGDADRLQQVVWNLLSNAIKFSSEDGRIEVHLRRADGELAMTVADEGPGVPVHVLPHIFERFRQADASSTRQHGGLGLGLAIVRSLVDLHGGTVDAANRTSGRGCVFTVRLPVIDGRVARELPVAPETDTAGSVTPSLDGIRIVLVDDASDDREVLSSLLRESGAEVIEAASAEEGLAAIRRVRPDLVVSDIAMPQEDGYSLLRKLRDLPRDLGGLTPAIALTAYAAENDRLRALEAGFQAHLAKPVDPGRLVLESSRLLARSRRA
jgi:signal transduction histidine kinase